MTKKDFEALADAMHGCRPLIGCADTDSRISTWNDAVAGIVDVCRADNPRFDRSRFLHRATLGHNLTQKCCK